MKRILTLTFAIATVSFVALGEMAISVDGKNVNKQAVLDLAQKIFNSRNNIHGLGDKEEAEIIREAVLDMEYWMIVELEVKRRNIRKEQMSSADIDLNALKSRAKYAKIDPAILKVELMTAIFAGQMLRLDNINPPSDLTELRNVFLSRYAPLHRVELADCSGWKIDRYRGRLVQDSKYNALEHELDENSGAFKKTIYYIHHYTIRYYVLFLRWYIGKAEALVAHAKGNWSESTTRWVSNTVLYVIPYLFHLILVFAWVKCNGRKVRIFGSLFLALLLSGVSTILFYFGMSPWSLFVVCVGVPLGIYMAPSIFDSMTSKTVYKRDQYGNRANKGEGYTADGELVKINEQDVIHDIEFTKPEEGNIGNKISTEQELG